MYIGTCILREKTTGQSLIVPCLVAGQIKSIERIISTLEQTIAEGAGQGDEGIRMEIAMLRNERAQLCAGFLGDTIS
jgi:hypothetical protein